jgi:hypothetical protein
MQLFKTEVEVDGQRLPALQAQCDQCHGIYFSLFKPKRLDHLHAQCMQCNAHHCPEGRCEKPESPVTP